MRSGRSWRAAPRGARWCASRTGRTLRSGACSGELRGVAHEQVPGRQDLAAVRGHRYGVLVLGGELLICGHHSPAVFQIAYLGSPLVDHRLDSERHALPKAHAVTPTPEVVYMGLLVELVSDAVAAKLPNDPVTIVLRELLDGGSDVTEALSWSHLGDPGFQALPGDVQECTGPR